MEEEEENRRGSRSHFLEEEVITRDCSSFVREEALTTMVATHATRERERKEREETFIDRNTEGEVPNNPDDLNTRFIQINNHPFSLNKGALL